MFKLCALHDMYLIPTKVAFFLLVYFAFEAQKEASQSFIVCFITI